MRSNVSRAKQFLPFDALKGFSEALREKEIEYEEKKELSEESLVELNDKFNQIEIGRSVRLRFYRNGKYIEVLGRVTNIDYIRKKIQIDNNININTSDIISIIFV